MYHKICLFSYNSRGFSKIKQDTIKNLVTISKNKTPIICNQENFLLKSNGYLINKALDNFHVVFNPAEKTSHDKGRAKNGMFTAIPHTFRDSCQDVSPGHWRVQAVVVTIDETKYLVINVYFPTNPRTIRFDDRELLETLAVINDVINNNDFSHLLIAGDINFDFRRGSGHVNSVAKFVEENGLLKACDKFPFDFSHMSNDDNGFHTSLIYHFLWNSDLDIHIEDSGVIHSTDNDSDHCVIFCVIKCNQVKYTKTKEKTRKNNPDWNNSTDEMKTNYRNALNNNLKNVTVPEDKRMMELGELMKLG